MPVPVEGACPQPDEHRLPSCLYLHAVGVSRMIRIDRFHHNIVIPHRHTLVSLVTADAIRVEAQNVDLMRPVWNRPEEPKSVGRRAADRPGGDSLTDRLKRRVWLCDIPERFQLLQFFKYSFSRCRKYRTLPHDHLHSSCERFASVLSSARSDQYRNQHRRIVDHGNQIHPSARNNHTCAFGQSADRRFQQKQHSWA